VELFSKFFSEKRRFIENQQG